MATRSPYAARNSRPRKVSVHASAESARQPQPAFLDEHSADQRLASPRRSVRRAAPARVWRAPSRRRAAARTLPADTNPGTDEVYLVGQAGPKSTGCSRNMFTTARVRRVRSALDIESSYTASSPCRMAGQRRVARLPFDRRRSCGLSTRPGRVRPGGAHPGVAQWSAVPAGRNAPARGRPRRARLPGSRGALRPALPAMTHQRTPSARRHGIARCARYALTHLASALSACHAQVMHSLHRSARLLILLSWMALLTWWSGQGNLPIDQPSVAGPLHGLQHRLAHLIAFGLLGVLGRWAFDGWPRAFLLAVLLTSAFGATDEWHQSFTPGRGRRSMIGRSIPRRRPW